jgi:Rieske Fe-S protein
MGSRRRNDTNAAGVARRTILKGAFGMGASLALAPAAAFAQGDQASSRPKEGDLLVKVDDPTLKPMAPDDIPLASAPVMAWALEPADKVVRSGSRLNRILLVRLDADALAAATRARAADGVVAYTAVCTHEGCDVGGWLAAEQMLFCECHQSKFDPRDAARVVDGPAPRGLPALPLKVADGVLVVARPFTARVGAETI